ncbi:MAG TPA: DUF4058 family protein [Gemmataceae bacterium]|nr:DUF4058 family protein [Gemmataceae bacterium]
MPSPFPGMDPYLEDPAVFPDLHGRLITYLSEFLNAVLPTPYFTGIASRVWIEVSQRRVEPDVNVLRPTESLNGGAQAGSAGGGVAVAEAVATEPIVIPFEREEVRQAFLEIRAQPGERLVTTIEVLSPANKTAGQGRTLYLQKQEEMLQSPVHLVEIDLLRAGVPTTVVPMGSAVRDAGFFDYHACVHRWDRPNVCFLYPIQLQGRLPILSIPLLPEDRPVVVDLKAVLDRAYDSGQYRRRVHYQEPPPPPPLHPNQLAWVEQILTAAGLREPPPAAPPA